MIEIKYMSGDHDDDWSRHLRTYVNGSDDTASPYSGAKRHAPPRSATLTALRAGGTACQRIWVPTKKNTESESRQKCNVCIFTKVLEHCGKSRRLEFKINSFQFIAAAGFWAPFQ